MREWYTIEYRVAELSDEYWGNWTTWRPYPGYEPLFLDSEWNARKYLADNEVDCAPNFEMEVRIVKVIETREVVE